MSLPDSTAADVAGERRPIASRQTAWAQRIAARLAAAGISPNAISVAGMGFGILAGACFAITPQVEPLFVRLLLVFAAVGVQLRLLCNLFDGMVAVNSGQFSPSGELYNEVPDRVSDAAILIGAGYAVGSLPVLGFLAAVVALFVAYVRAMGKIVTGKQDFRGLMAKPQRMAFMTIAALYVAFTPASWQPGLGPDGTWGSLAIALALVIVGGAWTAWRRLVAAASACEAAARGKED